MESMDQKTKAKQKRIQDIFPGELKRYGSILRGSCPFHQDSKTANLTIYPATNTFYCFACGKFGDVITLYQKLHNVDFKQAIKELA